MKRDIKDFYSRTEEFSDPNSHINLPDSVTVGSRLIVDFVNGIVQVEESRFANATAFEEGAMPFNPTVKTYTASGEEFALLRDSNKDFFKSIKPLMDAVVTKQVERQKEADELAQKQKQDRINALKEQLEREGYEVVKPDEKATKSKSTETKEEQLNG